MFVHAFIFLKTFFFTFVYDSIYDSDLTANYKIYNNSKF